MKAKLACLLLAVQLNLLIASDYHVVPTLNLSSGEESPRYQPNHDRVVPQINLSPLGVHHDAVISDNNNEVLRREKFPLVIDSDEEINLKNENTETAYPSPRPRIQEDLEKKTDPKTSVPTPRPRIVDPSEDLDKSVSMEKEDPKVIRDDPKPNVYYSKPKAFEFPESEESNESLVKGQPEVILVLQDVESVEEELDGKATGKKIDDDSEVSTETISRYIDEIDQAYKGKIAPYAEVSDKVVDSAGSRKYVIKDSDSIYSANRLPREAPKESKASMSQQTITNDKIPAVGGEKISNERKTSGGLSYNVGFEPAKASKPQLDSKTRTKREGARPPIAVSDMENSEIPKVTASKDHPWNKAVSMSSESSSESASSEVIRPDPQLPKLDLPTDEDKTFSEVLHKAMKGHQKSEQQEDNKSDVYTQEINRLPHRGPTIKNPTPFLAVDPPVSSEEKSTEDNETVAILVIEKTIVLEDDNADENKSQNVYIENADVNVNVISTDLDDEEEASFWQNGFTIGVHVSPLALCLGTALILFVLIMRLALKMYKKRLVASMVAPVSYNEQKKSAQFDNVSLQTVSTN